MLIVFSLQLLTPFLFYLQLLPCSTLYFYCFLGAPCSFPSLCGHKYRDFYNYSVGTVASIECYIIPFPSWVNLAKKKIVEGNLLCHV